MIVKQVNSPDRFTVSVWQPPASIQVSKELSERGYEFARLMGITISLLLHGCVVLMVFANWFTAKVPTPAVNRPITAEGAMTIENIELLPIAGARSRGVSPYSFLSIRDSSIKIPRPTIEAEVEALIPSIDTDQLSQDDTAPSGTSEDDNLSNKARWTGIYNNQMKARIERVWKRPRGVINESTISPAAGYASYFHCQAEIRQDAIGNVLEVLLPSCNGSWQWQRSLVLAIQQSSPLPAPPDISVFNTSVTLSFIGYAFEDGMPEDEYEQPPLTVR